MAKEEPSNEMPGDDFVRDWKSTVSMKTRPSSVWDMWDSANSLLYSALIQQLEISKHEGPSKHDLSFLRGWLTGTDGNNSALRGCGSDAWNAGNGQEKDLDKDLVALSSKHRQRDRFERWAGDTLLGVFHRLVASRSNVSSRRVSIVSDILNLQNKMGADVESGLAEYSDEKISIAADIVCTFLAPLLTTVPMFVLFFVTGIKKRLGIIMAFTTLFSIRSVVWGKFIPKPT